jgi:hypothetical protein
MEKPLFCYYCDKELTNEEDKVKFKTDSGLMQYAHKECLEEAEKEKLERKDIQEVSIKPPKKGGNRIAITLKILGWVVIIIGVIAAFTAGNLGIISCVSAFISGIVFFGFAEVIRLLDSIDYSLKG